MDRIRTEIETHDERFRCLGDRWTEILYSGCRWAEGPAYFPAGRYLVFTDIPNDRILRWDETTGVVGVFRAPAGYANGQTIDGEGRLLTCEQGNRRVTRTEHDGAITVIADRVDGRRFNSPNDIVERSDGSIWFTDPSYGIDSDYEGHRAEREVDGCHVYRADPLSGEVRAVATDFVRPNGLAFSVDHDRLYVVDTESTPSHVRCFTVTDAGELLGGEVVATCDAGVFDGLWVDVDGRLWVAAGDGVHCFHRDGGLLGKVKFPEQVANLTFGGSRRNHLFVTASSSLYAVRLNVNGARRPLA